MPSSINFWKRKLMPEFSLEAYDAVIIGAGISGLVCGCYLAKAGMKVLKHDITES